MNYNNIIYEQENHVVTITLNRPEARNALTIESYTELTGALNAANTDHEVRAVIITGAGKGFCAGDDVKQVMLDPNRVEKGVKRKNAKSRINPIPMRLNCNTQDLGEYIVNSWRVLFQTEDHLEGARSFIEKRQPVFKGK